jgi:hypothetical protein
MATHVPASDWEVQGVAQVGAALGLGAAGYLFEFRSQNANCRASFLFLGVGVGVGGDMGGGSGPSLSDIVVTTHPSAAV